MRGSREFGSEQEYDRFLAGVLEAANRLRTVRLGEELAAMRETTVEDLPDYRELMVTVWNDSTIRVRKPRYSVPGSLIGAKLLARICENRIVFAGWRAGSGATAAQRRRPRRGHAVAGGQPAVERGVKTMRSRL